MSQIQIQAKRKDDAAPVTVSYDFADDLNGLIQQVGESVVYTKAKQAIIIDAQAMIRRAITPDAKGVSKTQAEIQALMNGWKPDNRTTTKKSAADKAKEAIGQMSEEDRKALLKQLKSEGLM